MNVLLGITLLMLALVFICVYRINVLYLVLFNRLAMTAVKALSPNVEVTVLKQSLWSDAEEQVLATIPSVSYCGNNYITYHAQL